MEAQLKRHEPLYLKHRPQALDELVGQQAVTRTLTNAINNDRISHAYLFTGPRGTGKTSSARILAKSLNCKAGEKATISPCQQCASCIEIKNGNSPAVFEIDAASNNSVDDARVLIERAPLVAPGARYKIYIIDECHMLTKEAFNALLKTIEDPPPNVVFVLATTEEHKVLPTIVSRCQRLMFRLVTQDDLSVHLRNVATKEEIEITDKAIDFVARRSGGGLRDALGLLDQASLLSAPGNAVDVADLLTLLGALHEDVLLEMSEHVLHRRGHELLGSANKLLHEGREPALLVQELAKHFLNLTKASYLAEAPDAQEAANKLIIGTPSYLEGLTKQAPQFDRSELTQLVEQLDRLESTCRRTTQPGMHLEVGLLALCHRQDMVLVRELATRVAQLEQALAGGAPMPARPVQHAAAAPARLESAPAPQPVRAEAPAQPARPEPAPVVAPRGAAETRPPEPTAQPVRTEPTPPPAPEPVAARPSAPPKSEPASDDTASSVSSDVVDSIWSQMLDELQGKHLPSFSLLSSQAFPLSMSDKEFTVGVGNDVHQSTVERYGERIQKALQAVCGKTLAIKVRVVKKQFSAPAPKPAPAPREREPVAAAPTSGGAPGPDDEEYEPAPRQKLDAAPLKTRSDLAPATVHGAEPIENSGGVATATPPSLTAAPDASNSRAATQESMSVTVMPDTPTAVSAEDLVQQTAGTNNGTIIKEATKLFDGPGSRIIGKKKPE